MPLSTYTHHATVDEIRAAFPEVLVLTVTPALIKAAHRAHTLFFAASCPLARAVMSQTLFDWAWVTLTEIEVGWDDDKFEPPETFFSAWYALPVEAHGGKPKKGTFVCRRLRIEDWRTPLMLLGANRPKVVSD